MSIQIEPISAVRHAIAAQMLRDYSIELEPDDYYGHEDAHAAELENGWAICLLRLQQAQATTG